VQNVTEMNGDKCFVTQVQLVLRERYIAYTHISILFPFLENSLL